MSAYAEDLPAQAMPAQPDAAALAAHLRQVHHMPLMHREMESLPLLWSLHSEAVAASVKTQTAGHLRSVHKLPKTVIAEARDPRNLHARIKRCGWQPESCGWAQ